MLRASLWSDLRAGAAQPRLRAIVLIAFALGVAFGVVLPFIHPLDLLSSFRQRRHEDLTVHPYIDQAKLEPLTYEQVVADPAAAKGKTVIWCVDHPYVDSRGDRRGDYGSQGGISYAEGRPSWPLIWTNDESVPRNSPTSGGRCTKVVAKVEGSKPGGVVLTYLGQP